MSRSLVAVSRNGTKLSKKYQHVILKSLPSNGLRRFISPVSGQNDDPKSCVKTAFSGTRLIPNVPPILEDLRRHDLTQVAQQGAPPDGARNVNLENGF